MKCFANQQHISPWCSVGNVRPFAQKNAKKVFLGIFRDINSPETSRKGAWQFGRLEDCITWEFASLQVRIPWFVRRCVPSFHHKDDQKKSLRFAPPFKSVILLNWNPMNSLSWVVYFWGFVSFLDSIWWWFTRFLGKKTLKPPQGVVPWRIINMIFQLYRIQCHGLEKNGPKKKMFHVLCSPLPWGNAPIWPIFFRWVEKLKPPPSYLMINDSPFPITDPSKLYIYLPT